MGWHGHMFQTWFRVGQYNRFTIRYNTQYWLHEHFGKVKTKTMRNWSDFQMDSGFSLQIPTCYLSYTKYVVVLLPVDLPERLVTAPNGQQREWVLTLQSLQHKYNSDPRRDVLSRCSGMLFCPSPTNSYLHALEVFMVCKPATSCQKRG